MKLVFDNCSHIRSSLPKQIVQHSSYFLWVSPTFIETKASVTVTVNVTFFLPFKNGFNVSSMVFTRNVQNIKGAIAIACRWTFTARFTKLLASRLPAVLSFDWCNSWKSMKPWMGKRPLEAVAASTFLESAGNQGAGGLVNRAVSRYMYRGCYWKGKKNRMKLKTISVIRQGCCLEKESSKGTYYWNIVKATDSLPSFLPQRNQF